MPIKPEAVESIIEEIAAHIRGADPSRLEITLARRVRPLKEHGEPTNAFIIGNDLTITVEIKGSSAEGPATTDAEREPSH